MNVFDLMATLRLDSSEYESGLDAAEEKSSTFADVLKANLVTKGIDVAIDGFKKLGSAAVGIIQDSVDAYGEYEQLVGGVETLFGESSQAVVDNAKKAFETAGMSANEYLQTVSTFSTALIQSTGRGAQQDLDELKNTFEEEVKETKRGLQDQYDARKEYWDEAIRLAEDSNEKVSLRAQRDEDLKAMKRENEDRIEMLKEQHEMWLKNAEDMNNFSQNSEESLQRAAELADMAITDMSDNVNKLGTDMSSVQNAYSGFARQNFMMLDNLRLGYQGSESEMKRLLHDAERLKQEQGETVKYSMNSYADIVEAIHVIQENLGVSGTTAKEASETIQGSLSAVKAAWENLVAGISNPDADLGDLIDNLIEKGKIALENLLPTIRRALSGLAQVIKEIAPIIADELPGLVEEVLPPLIEAATTLAAAIVTNLPTILSVIVDAMPSIIETIGGALQESWPALSEAIMEALSTTGGQVLAVVLGIVAAVKGYGIITGIMNIIGTIGSLGTSIMGFASSAMPVITEAVGTATTAFGGFSIATAGMVAGIGVAVAEIINGVNQLIDAHHTYEEAFNTHQSEIDSALSNYAQLYNEKGKEIADQWAEMVYQIDTSNMSLEESQKAISEKINGYWDGVPQNMWEGFKQGWDSYFGADGKGLFALLGDAFDGAVGGIMGLLGIHSPSTVFEGISKNMVLGMINGFNDYWKTFTTNILTFVGNIPKMFSNLPAAMLQIGSNLITSLGNGLMNAMGGVLDRVRSIGTSIVNAAKSVFGIASPSKVFTEIGRFIDDGLADGIVGGLGMVEDAMDDLDDVVASDTDDFGVSSTYRVETLDNGQSQTTRDRELYGLLNEIRDAILSMDLTMDGQSVSNRIYGYMDSDLGMLARYRSREALA